MDDFKFEIFQKISIFFKILKNVRSQNDDFSLFHTFSWVWAQFPCAHTFRACHRLFLVSKTFFHYYIFDVTLKATKIYNLENWPKKKIKFWTKIWEFSKKVKIFQKFQTSNHVATNQVKDAADEDFENIFQCAVSSQTLLDVTRSWSRYLKDAFDTTLCNFEKIRNVRHTNERKVRQPEFWYQNQIQKLPRRRK